MTVNKITNAPTQNELVNKVNEIIDGKQDNLTSGVNIKTINDESLLGSGNITIQTGGTVDQTYDGTSSNAQSGVAIAGANFVPNTATGTNSLSLAGSATASDYATNIGVNSSCYSTTSSQSVAIGTNALAQGSSVVAVGRAAKGQAQGAIAIGQGTTSSAKNAIVIGNGATVSGQNAIQLGTGTNSIANTFNVSYGSSNTYQMLDSSGKIPDDRLNTTIARTSQIPTVPTNISAFINDAGYTTNVGTVTSVNNTSPDSSGNVTISIPAEQVQSNWNETNTSSKAYIQNKPTIPSVGNGTITITQGGATKGTFTTNQSGDSTIDLDAGDIPNYIGEIKQSLSPITSSSLLELNGQTINTSDYPEFTNYISQLWNNGDSSTANVTRYYPCVSGNVLTSYIPKKYFGGKIIGGRATNDASYVSGMNAGDYLTLTSSTSSIISTTDGYDIQLKFMTPAAYHNSEESYSESLGFFNYGCLLSIGGDKGTLLLRVNSSGQLEVYSSGYQSSSWNIFNGYKPGISFSNRTVYTLRIQYVTRTITIGTYYFYVNGTLITSIEKSIQAKSGFISDTRIGNFNNDDSYNLLGWTLFLDDCYIAVAPSLKSTDYTYIWKGTKPYTGGDLYTLENDKYGSCGRYVYDSASGTITMPNINCFLEGLSSNGSRYNGDIMPPGIPDVQGLTGSAGSGSGAHADGAFFKYGTMTGEAGGSGGTDDRVMMQARGTSLDSSKIYGYSSTVQPTAVRVKYYVVVK